jgi:quinol-cytochrome oxidoreductase complex cytochrome b subunit
MLNVQSKNTNFNINICIFANNPNGVSSNGDRYAFHPYFIFKDLVTIFLFFLILSIIVFYYPNLLGHSDNYIPANPMSTPVSIVPEWYINRCHTKE